MPNAYNPRRSHVTLATEIMRIIKAIALLLAILVVTSCSSLRRNRPFLKADVHFSQIAETTIEFNPSRYKGVDVKLINDLGSDIFFLYNGWQEAEEKPRYKEAFIYPDLDEIERRYYEDQKERIKEAEFPLEISCHPFWSLDSFVYVWNGNSTPNTYFPDPSPERDHYEIIYYHCADQKFYSETLKIVETTE